MFTPDETQAQKNQGALMMTSSIIESNNIASAEMHLQLSKMVGTGYDNKQQ